MQDETPHHQDPGAHLDVKYGGDELPCKVGAAYDDAFRQVIGIDARSPVSVRGLRRQSQRLPAAAQHPAALSGPECGGQHRHRECGVGGSGAPAYPGYGTGYSAGFAP